MDKYINKATITGSVAIIAGMFLYKQFVERHVVKIAGGNS